MTTMYNQQSGYAQPGYPPPQGFNPPQGFPPPGFPHAGGGFYAQYNAYDPAAFRTFYREQLRQLVQNSRPVIQQLTQLAIENLGRMGHVVAESIAEYIHNAPTPVKLPAFYLLDSITKNCYPYVALFGPFVKDMFLQTTCMVDMQTRQKLCEMLVTWRNGGPNGTPLFGEQVQAAIEREIWPESDNSRHGYHGGGPSYPTQSQVLTELEVLLALKEKSVQDNPYDMELRGQIDALLQLRSMVQTSGVTPNELSDILTSVRSLAKSIAAPGPPAPQPAPQSAAGSYPTPQPQQYFQPTPSTGSMFSSGVAPSQPAVLPNQPVSQPAQGAPAPMIPDISSLFKSLVAAGLVGPAAPSAARPAQGTVVSEADKRTKLPVLESTEMDETLEYERRILALDVKLTSADLLKERPEVVSLLYDRQSTQCNQCGLRFHDDAKGKKRFQDHLDQHFRQNNRASQQLGRGYSRSWFIDAEDWIHDSLTDTGDHLHAHKVGRSTESAAKKRKDLERSFVVIPPGEDTKPKFCPICREQLKMEFLEDEEEWVWRNAVEHKSTIYHATCHADALSATLANRLRAETKGSRAVTPERRSGTPQPQVATVKVEVNGSTNTNAGVPSTKRKVEDDADIKLVKVKVEEDDEPPFKRAKPSV